ncbi:MAG: MBL fold metallo-hydrolase [Acidobacteriota bacterium]
MPQKLPVTPRHAHFDRREMLTLMGLFGLHGLFGQALGAAPQTAGTLVIHEKWARVDRLGEGLWSVVSDPLSGNFQTVCNGGIISGTERTVVFDAFMMPEGGRWVAEVTRKLTGRWPTDVVISHYHGDHVNGLAGFRGAGGESPRLWMTEATRRRVIETDGQRENPDAVRLEMLEAAETLPTDRVTRLDLGGRIASLRPHQGHTDSDVTLEIEEPRTLFWGDLLWFGMFPNFRDARPSALAEAVRTLLSEPRTHHVSGHGPVVAVEGVQLYRDLLDHFEGAARESFDKGLSPEEAAKAYALPERAADWHLFQPTYFETAMGAWHRELGGAKS